MPWDLGRVFGANLSWFASLPPTVSPGSRTFHSAKAQGRPGPRAHLASHGSSRWVGSLLRVWASLGLPWVLYDSTSLSCHGFLSVSGSWTWDLGCTWWAGALCSPCAPVSSLLPPTLPQAEGNLSLVLRKSLSFQGFWIFCLRIPLVALEDLLLLGIRNLKVFRSFCPSLCHIPPQR